jgi:hypothetical protein
VMTAARASTNLFVKGSQGTGPSELALAVRFAHHRETPGNGASVLESARSRALLEVTGLRAWISRVRAPAEAPEIDRPVLAKADAFSP